MEAVVISRYIAWFQFKHHWATYYVPFCYTTTDPPKDLPYALLEAFIPGKLFANQGDSIDHITRDGIEIRLVSYELVNHETYTRIDQMIKVAAGGSMEEF